jgi:hypothetical protein
MKITEVTLLSGETVRGDSAVISKSGDIYVSRYNGTQVIKIVDPIVSIEEIE